MTLKQQTMRHTHHKLHIILLLAGLLGVFITGSNLQPGYAQTNLQELQNRVAELEKKLVDVRARQEKAQSIQMQLEEQEQALASLAKSDKYRIQIVEIRSNIKNIRTRIEAITKEKNDLEESLRLANNLQAMLREARTTARFLEKEPCGRIATDQPLVGTKNTSNQSKSWKIENIRINDRLTNEENNEIKNIFLIGRYVNQDEILNCSYYVYVKTGAILNFRIYSRGENFADFEILLDRRDSRSSNYNPSSLTNYIFNSKIKTLNEFKNDDFRITVKND